MTPISKDARRLVDPPPHLSDYASACAAFSWEEVAASLGVPLPGPLNLGGLAVGRAPAERPALVWIGGRGEPVTLTYGELRAASGQFANALKNLGVQRGDRVLFLLRPLPELVSGVLGALRFGAVPSVLASGKSIDYVRNIATRTGAKMLVLEPESKALIDPLRKELPDLWHVVVLQKKAGDVRIGPGDFPWGDVVSPMSGGFEDAACAATDPAWIHYTDVGMSGAVLSHQAAFALSHSARLALDVHDADRVMVLSMPGEAAFVPYGVLAPLLCGATQVMVEEPVRFRGYGDLARNAPVAVWYSAFKALEVILRNEPGLSDLLCKARHIAVGPPWEAPFLAMTALSYGSPLHPVWWDREMGSIQLAEFRAFEIRPDSWGRPLPGTELAVQEGKLAVRVGPGCPFLGYWGEEGSSRSMKEGWFKTAHAVRCDGEGWVWPATPARS